MGGYDPDAGCSGRSKIVGTAHRAATWRRAPGETSRGSAILDNADTPWPELSYAQWRETAATLQLGTQIVGKVRLTLTPWLNHGWQVPPYITARGLGTSPMPAGSEILEIELDFIDHRLVAWTSRGDKQSLVLEPQTVADFHRRVIHLLDGVGVALVINDMPNEVANPIRFSQDRIHTAYDRAAAYSFWRALIQVDLIFKLFRTGFLGKASPVHFFWGSFDLAVTRFSGRKVPLIPAAHPGCLIPSLAKPIRTRLAAPGSGPGNEAFRRLPFIPMPIPNRPVSATKR